MRGDKNLNEKGKATQFSTKAQPTPEQKKEGWAKKKKGMELARAILALKFAGKGGKRNLKKTIAKFFNVPEEEITVEQMILLRQAEKAINSADTNAAKTFMELSGNLKQKFSIEQHIEQFPDELLDIILQKISENAADKNSETTNDGAGDTATD